MNQRIVLVLISFIFLIGCSVPVYKGSVKPIYPEISDIDIMPTTVDSLTPTFRWQSDTPSACKNDFAIWDVGERIHYLNHIFWPTGTLLYYKEALSQPEHTIEVPLAPDTIYCWSVRSRCGDDISDWATFDYLHLYGGFLSYAQVKDDRLIHSKFMFKTPKSDGE